MKARVSDTGEHTYICELNIQTSTPFKYTPQVFLQNPPIEYASRPEVCSFLVLVHFNTSWFQRKTSQLKNERVFAHKDVATNILQQKRTD